MKRRLFAATIAGWLISTGAFAQTATTTFGVQITIQAECLINSASILDFGTTGVLAANVDATSSIGVQCTTGTPYNVGLNAGLGAGATVANRLMTGPGAATIGYSIYQNAAHSVMWGSTIGTDTVASVGNGALQNLAVYGRVPPQNTPAAGTYTDTVTVTLTY